MNEQLDWVARRLRSAAKLVVAVAMGPLAHPEERPALVLGNQKSGTTAIAAALGRGSGRAVTQDLIREVVSPRFDELAAGSSDIDDLVRRNAWDFSRPIVKEPHLTPFADLLRERFPDSPIAVVVRDPRDNIRSILDRLGVGADHVDRALAGTVRNRAGWELVLDCSWLGRSEDSTLASLCRRWLLCADAALRPDVATIRYEDFVADRVGSIGDLATGMGLPFQAKELGLPTVAHQPPGANRGVRPEQFFSPQQLALIGEMCGPTARRFGYD